MMLEGALHQYGFELGQSHAERFCVGNRVFVDKESQV